MKEKMNNKCQITKPRLFIASSSEGSDIADAIHINMDEECEVIPWMHSFKPSSTTLDDLIQSSATVDFALFVFKPDDLILIRNEEKSIVRDNVLFEMGIFIGAIGRKRTFMLKPRNEKLHLPSDLAGLTYLDYDALRSDQDLNAATRPACTKIKNFIKELPSLTHNGSTAILRQNPNPPNLKLNENDYQFLLACSPSHTQNPEGLSFDSISFSIDSSRKNKHLINLSALKLAKMGWISLSIELDDRDINRDINSPPRKYFSYSITDIGIDALLNHDFTSLNQLEDQIPF